MEIAGTIFCGLGLFFIGFRMISRNLRQLTGTKFRHLIQRAAGRKLFSAFSGFASGLISQSANASVFITAGFNSAGLLTFRQSMRIINWANIGTSVLIFIVILNMKLLILYFIGIIGLAYFLQLDRSFRFQMMIQFFLGLALLFLGVQFMKSGAEPMEALPWFRNALKLSSGSVMLLLGTGILLTMAAQSGSTVSVVALSLFSAGLLTLVQTFVIVLGTGLGSAINILILSIRLKGSGKQLCLYEGLFKTLGVILVSILLLADHLLSGHGKPRLASFITADPGRQVACLFLLMQILPAILLSFLRRPVINVLTHISPGEVKETMSRPQYISIHSLHEPETALFLAEKEQLRLMRLLPPYLLAVSDDRGTGEVHDQSMLHDSFIQLGQHIDHYLEKLLHMPAAAGLQDSILHAQQFSALLKDVEANLEEFVLILSHPSGDMSVQPINGNLVESLKTILETALDFFENPEDQGLEIMLSLTADKGQLLQKIRQDYFQRNESLSITARQSIFSLTIIFDRAIWLLRSMTILKKKSIREAIEKWA